MARSMAGAATADYFAREIPATENPGGVRLILPDPNDPAIRRLSVAPLALACALVDRTALDLMSRQRDDTGAPPHRLLLTEKTGQAIRQGCRLRNSGRGRKECCGNLPHSVILH
jgi:hypothetical protein